MLGAAEAGALNKRPPSIGPVGNKQPCGAGVEEMVEAVVENPATIGGEMNPKLWTVNQVAELLNLSPGTIYHFLSEQKLPCVRISGRCVRFDPRQIEAWVAQRTEEPETK